MCIFIHVADLLRFFNHHLTEQDEKQQDNEGQSDAGKVNPAMSASGKYRDWFFNCIHVERSERHSSLMCCTSSLIELFIHLQGIWFVMCRHVKL